MLNSYIVYYMRPEVFRDFCFGGSTPTVADLHKTHKRVRAFIACNLENVFHRMQAEIWSPNGEARQKIDELGLSHTSMSVGDVVYDRREEKYFVVASVGFKEIN